LKLIRDYYKAISKYHIVDKKLLSKYGYISSDKTEISFVNFLDTSKFREEKDVKIIFFPAGPDLLLFTKEDLTQDRAVTVPQLGGGSLLSKLEKEVRSEAAWSEQFSQNDLDKAIEKFIVEKESAILEEILKNTDFYLKKDKIEIFVDNDLAKRQIQYSELRKLLISELNTSRFKLMYHIRETPLTREVIYDLSDSELLKIWEKLKIIIKETVEKELRYRSESQKGIKNQNDLTEVRAVLDKIEKFKSENPNGYNELAEFLNPLLNKFHLEVNTKIDLEKFDEIEFLDLRAKDGAIIPIEKWSTGIRQLIYTILPLYTIKPKTGIIMIDEAERSLYPNTQRILIDFYKKICPDMQLIFATHSPILASSFEPWEVIELKFNEKGKVERKPYYKGENHVDNYHIHPMYLTWNSLFMDMFGVVGESNDARTEKLMELAMLDNEVKNTTDKAKKKELFKKYEKIAEKLAWRSL